MKHIHYFVTIPAGKFAVRGASGNGKNLDYIDFFDSAMLYRYFDPNAVTIERITPRTFHKAIAAGMPFETFQTLHSYGSWRY